MNCKSSLSTERKNEKNNEKRRQNILHKHKSLKNCKLYPISANMSLLIDETTVFKKPPCIIFHLDHPKSVKISNIGALKNSPAVPAARFELFGRILRGIFWSASEATHRPRADISELSLLPTVRAFVCSNVGILEEM